MYERQAKAIRDQAKIYGYTDAQVIFIRDTHYGTPKWIVLVTDMDGKPVRVDSWRQWELLVAAQ
jgi:hypothetical protein